MLNALSGAMKDETNAAYDPRNNNCMCINGQLMLLDLIEHLEVVPGFELIQSNTDGLIIWIPDTDEAFEMVDDICWEWEQRCSTDQCSILLELDNISEIYQKDVNNYLWVGIDGGVERIGAYVKELSAVDNDLPILNKALVDYMVKKTPVEQTINQCDDLIMFQKIVKLSDKYDWVEHEHCTPLVSHIGKRTIKTVYEYPDNRQKLVNELNNTLTQNIILGKDPQKAIDEIARKMNTSKTNAGRLVMTEEAFFSSAAQKDCFTELDVEQFEIVATLDSHTSDICRGMDGKHFPMSEWKVGVTAPPFHVHCRSTTVPYFDDEFDAVGERAARDEETGKTYFVPGNMTYKEWEKAFVNGDKSGLQAVNSDDTIKEKEPSEAFQQIQKACEADKVEHRPVQKLSQPLSSDEIIERLAGGDMTKGSCSSLAFAYIGNRNGLDVLDFRGGSSQYVFSMNSNIKKILELPGVNGSITMVKKEISGTMEVLNNLVLNKEYYLATGKHAAIVRRVDSGVEYLELQSKFQNGWMPFDRYGSMAATLNKRFGCRKTVDKQFGKVWEKSVVLMDVESFNENTEFEQILGYINTAVESQKKGVTGDVK